MNKELSKKKWLPWPSRMPKFAREGFIVAGFIYLATLSCQTLTEGGSVAAGAATGSAVGGPGGAAVGGTVAYLVAKVSEAEDMEEDMVVLREEAGGWFALQDIVDKFWWMLIIVGILFLLAWLADSPMKKK